MAATTWREGMAAAVSPSSRRSSYTPVFDDQGDAAHPTHRSPELWPWLGALLTSTPRQLPHQDGQLATAQLLAIAGNHCSTRPPSPHCRAERAAAPEA